MTIHATAPQSLRLNTLSTPLGDAPSGRLGGASVRMETPREARSVRRQITGVVKSLAERTALALGPAAPKAKSEVLAATIALSSHLENALGALSDTRKGLQNQKEAKTALLALVKDAQSLEQHGIGFDDALATRLDMHLKQLDRTQLTALAKGTHSTSAMNMIGDFADRQQAAQALGMIANRATQRLTLMVEHDIKEYLLTGLADVMTQVDANDQEQFSQQYLSLTERVVSELTSLTGTGAILAAVDVSATTKRYIDEAKAQLPEVAQGRLSACLNPLQPQRAAAAIAFKQAITTFTNAAKTGNLGSTLDSAEQAHQELQTLSRAHQILDGAFANSHEQTNFLRRCCSEAVGELPQQDQDALAQFFALPETQNLANTCMNLGSNPKLCERNPALAKQLDTMSASLEMIAQATVNPLPKRAIAAGESLPGNDPGPRVSTAIFRHFNILAGKEVQRTPMSPELQQYFTDNFPLLNPVDVLEEEPHFYGEKNLIRWLPSYVVNGNRMTKGDNTATQTALLAFCGTQEMVMAVTQVANLKAGAFAYSLLLDGAGGIIRLPDGRSIRPSTDGTTEVDSAIEIGKNASGEITVTTRSDYTNIDKVVDQDNEYVSVEPGAEIHYSVEITLAADGSPRVSRPPEFQISSLIPR